MDAVTLLIAAPSRKSTAGGTVNLSLPRVLPMREAGDDGMDMPLKALPHEGKIRDALERVLHRELEGWECAIPEETADKINTENARRTLLVGVVVGVVVFIATAIVFTFAAGVQA